MKTLSFHEARIGRQTSKVLLSLDTAKDGVSLSAGLNLIVAPNGRGKSTLLQSVAGVLPLLGGEIRVDGKKTEPEKDVLYVSEYLSFPKFIYPMEWVGFMTGEPPGPALHSELAPWIKEFELEAKMKSYLGRMSQGERRKITWLGAHRSRKPVQVLDEPLDGLDLLGIHCARKMLQEWRKEQRILLVVAHQVGELLDLSDSVYLIGEGRLIPWKNRFPNDDPRTLAPERFRSLMIDFYWKG